MAGPIPQHTAYREHWLMSPSSLLRCPQSPLKAPALTCFHPGQDGEQRELWHRAPAGTRGLRQLHGHTLAPGHTVVVSARSGLGARDTQLLILPRH